jgi:hyperosmotically inducible protein
MKTSLFVANTLGRRTETEPAIPPFRGFSSVIRTRILPSLALAVCALLAGRSLLHASETDENLEASARGAYVFRTLLAADALSVEVSNGVVTLRGTVPLGLQRELAEEAAAAMAGVRSVDNQITVKPATEAGPDATLSYTVQTVLGWHRSGRGVASHLEVKEGVVILRGEVEDEAARLLAAEYSAGIEGVKGVKNELVLKAAAPGETAKPPTPNEIARDKPAIATPAGEVDDPSVSAQVRMALRVHRSTRTLKPGVEVRDGVLTLTGHASTEEEMDQAGRLCADILGVKKVLNKMTPEPESTQN